MIFDDDSVGQNMGYVRKVLMSQSTNNGKQIHEKKSIYFSEDNL